MGKARKNQAFKENRKGGIWKVGNKKIGLGLMLNLIGAMFAYLIGSGFASGQETMQYFSGWGSVWASLGVAAIALLLSCLA